MGLTLSQAFPTLTAVKCDCCGETFVDEVGLMLVSSAVVAYRDELIEQKARERHAWEQAEVATQRALQAAGA